MVDVETCHEKELEMLQEIDRICAERGICYSVAYGTMLGAVREQGFIPWDDDADILVLREDYPAFAAAMREELNQPFGFWEPQASDGFFYDFISRVVNYGVALHDESYGDSNYYDQIDNRLCIDVFIFDRFPSKAAVRRAIFLNKVIYGLAISKRKTGALMKHSKLQNAQIAVLSTIGKLLSFDAILALWNKNATKFEDEDICEYRYCANISLSPRYQKAIPNESICSTVKMPFEGILLPVASGYDEFLSITYGDYMTPPDDLHEFITHTDSAELEAVLAKRKMEGAIS